MVRPPAAKQTIGASESATVRRGTGHTSHAFFKRGASGKDLRFYFPDLVAAAGAGYERAFIPFPTLKVDQRQIVQQIEQDLPKIAANPQAASQRLETPR
ncbi:MAG: hypothetical protein QOE70_553 [Chthoniobacter sp.]|jgi:hypothetical protein|nr:hypothetical protein [Chthoniobacter sp.]